MAERDWERLRRMVCGRAGGVCEACGDGPDRREQRWLEVHERCVYLEARHLQRLRRLVCLCSPCHAATHIGLAGLRGHRESAIWQLCRVNRWTTDAAEAHVAAAFAVWRERSTTEWSLDVSMLTDARISLRPPPNAPTRSELAEAALRAGNDWS